ncbi:MAG: UbiD family decarboxylase [Betaproteobacteria bacterium]|nr:UbiD family decarboxylase [Betaproteobacteria bacterium]
MFDDLREFVEKAQGLGECKVIEGAHWDVEMGRIAELSLSVPDSPLLMFDRIQGYPKGFRVCTNPFTSTRRVALGLGLPLELKGLDLIRAWKEKVASIKPIPPVYVKTGPVKENVLTGKDVDVLKFPTPQWHELDGGRYIGTGCMVIQKDPDTGWVNMGTYRTMISDGKTVTFHSVPGRHGAIIAKKYWERGQSCPIAIVCGQGPQLWMSAVSPIPIGITEYDWAGGLRNKAVEVVKGETVDLPIPAEAEIVLEGLMPPPEVQNASEGPFGEWEGYYSGGKTPHPVANITAILHRNDPIQFGVPMLVGSHDDNLIMAVDLSAQLWAEFDKQIAGVKGVSFVYEARRRPMVVVSLKQMYPGHVKQAALIAAGCYRGATLVGRFVIIVDDDIDPTNMTEVLWALGTRCDPQTQIDFLTNRLSMASDPRLEPEKRKVGDLTCSTAIIDACRPWSWRDQFPKSTKTSPEVMEEVRKKWGEALFGKK